MSNKQEPTEQELVEQMSEDGQAMHLAMRLVTASMDSTAKTLDSLYETERMRRQALEVLIADVVENLDMCWGGTVREYERATGPLRLGIHSQIRELAARHHENTEVH